MRQVTTRFGADKSAVNVASQLSRTASFNAKAIGQSDTGAIDFGKITREAAQLYTNMNKTEKNVEANRAKQDYIKTITSEDYMNATETHKAETLENLFKGSTDSSQAYIDAFASYSAQEYVRANSGRNRETNTSAAINAPAEYRRWQTEFEEGYDASGKLKTEFVGITDEEGVEVFPETKPNRDPETFVAEYSEQFPTMDKALLNRSLIFGLMEDTVSSINLATTPEELQDAIKGINEVEKPFQTNRFFGTKSAEGKAAVTFYNQQKTNAIKIKQNEFKQKSYDNIATAEQMGYVTPPSVIKKDIEVTSDNTLAASRALDTYTKKYNEQVESTNFNLQYTIGSPRPSLPDNKLLKDKRQSAVTDALLTSFMTKNTKGFIDIGTNETGLLKEAGETLLNNFYGMTKTEDLQKVTSYMVEVANTPGGARALRQSIGDDGYVDIIATNFLATSIYEGDIGKARNYVLQGDYGTTRIPMKKKIAADITDLSTKLGSQAGAFNEVIQRLHNINPQVAEKEYKSIYKMFSDTVNKEDGVVYNTSMGAGPVNAINPERVNNLIVEDFINKYGSKPSEMVYIGDSTFIYDAFGGIGDIVNTKQTVQEADNLEIKEAQELSDKKEAAKGTLAGDLDTVGDVVPELLMGTVPTVFAKFGKNISTMLSVVGTRFTNNLAYQSLKVLGWEEANPIEQGDILNQLEEEKKAIMTTLPEVDRSTLSGYMEDSLKNSILKNKIKRDNLNVIENTIMSEGVKDYISGETYAMLADREGSREKVYIDSTGNPTVGIGHKLTEEEKKLYPVGTSIPQAQRFNWLKEDVKKAQIAANKQAKELNNPKLEEALVHVNFQLGTGWTKKFNKSWPLLKKGNYEQVIQNLRNSLWMKQTPTRVNDFIQALEER